MDIRKESIADLAATSQNTIEIAEGLEVGDEVILSGISNSDDYDRVRLN